MIVFVADQNSFACSSHSMLFVVFLQALQTCEHGRVLLGLVFFRTKGIVTKRIEPDRFRLIG